MKIGTKLLLIMALLIVLLGVTALSSVISSSNELENQIKDKFIAVSAYTMEKTHKLFYSRYQDMDMLAAEPVIRSRQSTPEEITGKLIEFKKHFTSDVPYASLSFFDLSRMRIADTEGTDIGIRHTLSEFWNGIRQGEEYVVSISDSESIGERAIHLARIVRDNNSIPFGVVVSRIPVEELQSIIERPLRLFKSGGTFNMDLVDKKGLLLYSTYNKKGMLKDIIPEWSMLKKTLAKGFKTGQLLYPDPQRRQEEKILIFAREESDAFSHDNDWTLIISLPKSEAMAPITELRDRLIVIVAIIGLFALGAAFLLSRTITNPIIRLRNAVTKVGEGALDIHVETTSRDEIGQLTKLFNNMVCKLRELHEKLRTAAAIDALTGIYNRNKIESILELEIERAKRYNSPLSLILFDLDKFKNINDTYGHQSGDYILKTSIAVIKTHIRQVDSLGRWGGEEFMLLAPGTALEEAVELAEKVRQCVELFAFEKVGTTTISCGVAQFNQEDTVDSFLKRADDALYRAKRRGRNLVEVGEMTAEHPL